MDILRTFEGLDLDQMRAYIRDKQEETLHLEFKTVGSPTLDKADRKNLAEALSGFANSDGGLIVWGIEARDLGDGVDCAVGERPIDLLPALMASLNKYTGELVNPDVEGVVHKAIPASDDNKGFAVTVIPASDSGPHMAKGTLDRYYKRSGSRFIKMEHFDIEDMFGRRKKPKLTLYAREIRRVGHDSVPGRVPIHFVEVIVGIRNSGRGPAKSPFVEIRAGFSSEIRYFDFGGGLQRLDSASDYIRYGALSGLVVHPGIDHDITRINVRVPDNAMPGDISDLIIDYSIAAEDMRMFKDRETVAGIELLKVVYPYTGR